VVHFGGLDFPRRPAQALTPADYDAFKKKLFAAYAAIRLPMSLTLAVQEVSGRIYRLAGLVCREQRRYLGMS